MRHESDRYRPIEGLELEMRDRLATKDAEITRLKADVTNRDEAIERMRRERSARVMGAHMDRVEAALGFQGGKPVIIDMVIARIEAKDAEIARLKAEVESWQSRFRALVSADAPDSAGNAVILLKAENERVTKQRDKVLLGRYHSGIASLQYSMSRADAERFMDDALKNEFNVRIINGQVEEVK